MGTLPKLYLLLQPSQAEMGHSWEWLLPLVPGPVRPVQVTSVLSQLLNSVVLPCFINTSREWVSPGHEGDSRLWQRMRGDGVTGFIFPSLPLFPSEGAWWGWARPGRCLEGQLTLHPGPGDRPWHWSQDGISLLAYSQAGLLLFCKVRCTQKSSAGYESNVLFSSWIYRYQ